MYRKDLALNYLQTKQPQTQTSTHVDSPIQKKNHLHINIYIFIHRVFTLEVDNVKYNKENLFKF